jgi:hypothetical protein
VTKLDLVLARIRKLPRERQDALAEEIEFRLDHDGEHESVFTDAEWAAIEASMDESGELIPHAQIVAEMRAKFPG